MPDFNWRKLKIRVCSSKHEESDKISTIFCGNFPYFIMIPVILRSLVTNLL